MQPREPSPTNYERIKIGDVGFIRQGRFYLLFSAGSPLGERQLGEDVPVTFRPLDVGRLVRGQPLPPGCFRSYTVREGLGASTQSVTSRALPESPVELPGNRGAALVTRYPTYGEDALLQAVFEEYTKRHYESWVAFARNKEYGDDVRPILVSGFDMTKDFAVVAYSHGGGSLESDLTMTVPMFVSASGSTWGAWRILHSPHTNYGPWESISPDQAMYISTLHLEEVETIPSAFDKCVFIRYYTMERRFGLFPKVIRVQGPAPPGLGLDPSPALESWPI